MAVDESSLIVGRQDWCMTGYDDGQGVRHAPIVYQITSRELQPRGTVPNCRTKSERVSNPTLVWTLRVRQCTNVSKHQA